MSEHRDVVVVGGGQAGLAMSHRLKARGIDHVVLERAAVGHDWGARRWATFCLVTPNWQCRLPGFHYSGPDPHGFMAREEIVEYLQAYAASFDPPLREGVEVTALRPREGGGFELEVDAEEALTTDQVVLATGPYGDPVVPPAAKRVPEGIGSMHSSAYERPEDLPEGAVLVVGTGQSGCQIAEDLHLAGRRVHLALGSATRTARFYRGRDVVDWLSDVGHYDMPIDENPKGLAVRRKANEYVTGRDGGRDIDLRRFALEGMALYGRLTSLETGVAGFEPTLRASLDKADASSESIKDMIDEHIAEHGIDAPTEARYRPVWKPPADEPTHLDLAAAGITTAIWCTGYRPSYGWIDAPIFDGRGYPVHRRGVTSQPGLYVVGLPWLYTWGSGRFSGVARDAEHLAGRIVAARDVVQRTTAGEVRPDETISAVA